jgi:hypothetical protein
MIKAAVMIGPPLRAMNSFNLWLDLLIPLTRAFSRHHFAIKGKQSFAGYVCEPCVELPSFPAFMYSIPQSHLINYDSHATLNCRGQCLAFCTATSWDQDPSPGCTFGTDVPALAHSGPDPKEDNKGGGSHPCC